MTPSDWDRIKWIVEILMESGYIGTEDEATIVALTIMKALNL